MILTEIYFGKKYITPEEWFRFIKIISKYNGYSKKWKIIVCYNQNQFRYFVLTHTVLPVSINELDSFLLKQVDNDLSTNYVISFPYLKNRNMIDILNYCESKGEENLKKIEITIFPFFQKYYFNRTYLFFKYKDNYIRRRKYFTFPQSMISINFEMNSRFSYKKTPKYCNLLKQLHLFTDHSQNSLLKVDTFPYLQGNYYLKQRDYYFDKHSLIVGSSGCGKSKFISLFVSNILNHSQQKEKYKVVIIDPHASLEQEIGGLEDSKIIDFKTISSSVNLFSNHDDDLIATTELLMSLFKNLLGDMYNSKLERVMRHSIHLLLIYNHFSFSSLRKLLLDLEYRSSLLKEREKQIPSSIIDFFLVDFNDLKTKSYGIAISPIISFIDEMELVPVFNQENIENSIEDILNNNSLIIFSLNRVKLGDKIIKTIAGFIMQQMLQIILKSQIEEYIIFIIDEVAVVENPILSRFLSEARKYGLSLILAGQYLNQISDEIKYAIFANTVNYYAFRLSQSDANLLVDHINIDIPMSNKREDKIKLLTELNNRECMVRISSNDILYSAFKAKTLDFKSIPYIQKEGEALVYFSKKREENIVFSINTNLKVKDIMIDSSSARKKLR